MERQTVSTNYIALQPPYRVIKHGKRMGIQIGIHRATIASGPTFRIETHDYPVVAVENKQTALEDQMFQVDASSEGEVWDNVETSQVSELCRLDDHLDWMDFIRIVWHDHSRLGDPCAKLQRCFIFKKLLKYFGGMTRLSPGQYAIRLHTELKDGQPVVVRSHREDELALNVEWTDNLNDMERHMVADILDYLTILSPNTTARWWRMTYETDEERLRPLVDRLNQNCKATRFSNVIGAMFTVKAIGPYNKITTETPPPADVPPATSGKRGRPKHEFEDYLLPDAPEGLMPILETMLEGKSGKEAFSIILAITDVYIKEPDAKSICRRFTSIDDSSYSDAKARHFGRNSYAGNAKPIDEDKLEHIREEIKRKLSTK